MIRVLKGYLKDAEFEYSNHIMRESRRKIWQNQ